MFRSIQWKMVLIFFLLILLAMQLIGAYLMQSLERYYLKNLTVNLTSQAQVIASLTERYLAGEPEKEHLDQLLSQFSGQAGIRLAVVDQRGEVLSATPEQERLVGRRLQEPEVARAITGLRAEGMRPDTETGERQYYLAVPVRHQGQVVGAVYLAASLKGIYRTLGDIKIILFSATALALGVTVFLGLAVSRTITGPITEVTRRAAEMAGGNFDQRIEVRSRDEIGQLAAMFNHLTLRLRETMGEMSREKSKVEALLTHMADGILALDREGRVILANPAAAEMLGLPVTDLLGRQPAGVLPSVDADDLVRRVTAGETGVAERVEVAGPVQRVLQAHFASYKDEGGEIMGIVIVLHDVTEQERLETMRREFVANVSHELRTPLTTVKSYLETLLDGAIEDRSLARRFLTVVATETERMVRLVRDLLQLSQLDNRQAAWDMVALPIGPVIDQAVTKLRIQAHKKQLTVEVSCPPDLPPARADGDRIEQVFLNVISNAIEFTPPGGRIRVEAGADGTGFIVLRVQDTGIGIPADDLPRIFERFYRVDKARSRDLGGTGLGLSIAREIIEGHGGTIVIDSQVGRGTEVRFTLPVAVAGEPEGVSPVTAAGGEGLAAGNEPRGGGHR